MISVTLAQKSLMRLANVVCKLKLANPWKWTHIEEEFRVVRFLRRHYKNAK